MFDNLTTRQFIQLDSARWNPGATLGVLGIVALGIFLLWFPIVVLRTPLPQGLVAASVVTTVWQALATVVLPYWWAMSRLKMRPADLGLTTHNLKTSAVFGCALYALALVAFLHCSQSSLMQNHAVRHVDPIQAVALISTMSVIASGSDLFTRGFILLSLARYSHIGFAVLLQNLVWFVGHAEEIRLLADCLGVLAAVGLTLTLGIVGDVIVLKTRNVLGLVGAHILLNIVIGFYLRQL